MRSELALMDVNKPRGVGKKVEVSRPKVSLQPRLDDPVSQRNMIGLNFEVLNKPSIAFEENQRLTTHILAVRNCNTNYGKYPFGKAICGTGEISSTAGVSLRDWHETGIF